MTTPPSLIEFDEIYLCPPNHSTPIAASFMIEFFFSPVPFASIFTPGLLDERGPLLTLASAYFPQFDSRLSASIALRGLDLFAGTLSLPPT